MIAFTMILCAGIAPSVNDRGRGTVSLLERLTARRTELAKQAEQVIAQLLAEDELQGEPVRAAQAAHDDTENIGDGGGEIEVVPMYRVALPARRVAEPPPRAADPPPGARHERTRAAVDYQALLEAVRTADGRVICKAICAQLGCLSSRVRWEACGPS
ncbi:hypothetical protein [Nonomuraea sp. NPDC049400]|uniref:hypothetical protein n=1 Tax=Nonomuraea sp. NPDC049400 TaxID=3364352 RepID=UPI0037897D16